jgi:ABC-type phosphate transport system substrate-binding protein
MMRLKIRRIELEAPGFPIRSLALLLGLCGLMLAGIARAAESTATAVGPIDHLLTMPYQPQGPVEGTLRLAGSTTLQQAAAQWTAGFVRIHPKAVCELASRGSGAGWKSLASAATDIALMSRPLTDAERTTYERETGRRIVAIVAAFDRMVWVVNAANPIEKLPWSPESGLLRSGAQPTAATPADAVTAWGSLVADPAWAAVPIAVHGTSIDHGTRWHLDRLLTGTAACQIKVVEHETVAEVTEAVAADRGGLGLIGSNHGNWPGVKRIPLVVSADLQPMTDVVAGSARTPDCRPLFVVVTLPKEGGLSPLQREFLAYILSQAGQLDAAKDGLLPLSRSEIHAQRELLGWPVER